LIRPVYLLCRLWRGVGRRGLVGVFLAASGLSGFSGFGWVWRWGDCVHGFGRVIGLNGVFR
jgi:hypothetical protein